MVWRVVSGLELASGVLLMGIGNGKWEMVVDRYGICFVGKVLVVGRADGALLRFWVSRHVNKLVSYLFTSIPFYAHLITRML